MWVEYPGKQPNTIENEALTFWTRRDDSQLAADTRNRTSGFQFRLPAIDVAESFRLEKEYFWDAAPPARRLALLAGIGAIWFLNGSAKARW